MHATWRRRPWTAAALLARINQWEAAPRAVRVRCIALLLAALGLSVGTFVAAAQQRVGVLPVSFRWWLPVALAAWTATGARRRWRQAIAAHRDGWMQAWPLPSRQLGLEQATLATVSTLAIALWPAILLGVLAGAGTASQVGLNLAGCFLAALAGVVLGRWPGVGNEAVADTAPLPSSRGCTSEPFVGIAQLRAWQRRVIGRLSLRRWVLWMAPILLMAPSWMGLQGGVQLLLLLVWPLYARAMAGSLEALDKASRLLAATPLPLRRLYRQLLPRPLTLATCFVITITVDLAWLGLPPLMVAAGMSVVALFEGGRLANRCRIVRRIFTACVAPVRMPARELAR